MDDDVKSYQVGFGKPPKSTRFEKGRSGNPKGRPKGALNIATVLEHTLREKVIVNENGRRRTVTKLQAAATQLANKAASGDLRAWQLLSAFIRYSEERAVKAESTAVPIEIDERVVKGILDRFAGANREVSEDDDDNDTE